MYKHILFITEKFNKNIIIFFRRGNRGGHNRYRNIRGEEEGPESRIHSDHEGEVHGWRRQTV
jgi:hypothetical protein